MADTKISDLGTIASTSDGDLMVIVDDPTGTPTTKKVALSSVIGHNRAYGEIYVTGGASGQAAAVADTDYKINQFASDGLSSGVTVSASNDKITLTNAGIYWVGLSCSFSGTASKEFLVTVYWNGVAQHIKFRRKLGGGGDFGVAALHGIINATSAAKDVEVYFRCVGSTAAAFTMSEASLVVFRMA